MSDAPSDTVLLVDGSNQAFRAHFALQTDMRAPDGFPTRALFAYTGLLRRLVREFRPSHALVVFDKGLSFRNTLFPDYKGQRPDMPEDLRQQWPEFLPLSEALGLRAVAIDGVEADDVIATVALRAAATGRRVVIASSDKDFGQLVTDTVRLYDVGKQLLQGPDEIRERWGVGPERIVDLLSLMGDTSDNVPGVPGVGEKKAAKFIQQYGSADAVLAAASAIGGKTGEAIAAAADTVALARRLVTLVCDLDLPFAFDDLPLRPADLPALEAAFSRFNFRTMLAEVRAERAASGGEAAEAPAAAPAGLDRSAYRTILTADDLAALVRDLRAAGRFAYDSETTSLNPRAAQIVGMSFCWHPDFAVYVPIAHVPGPNCPGALDALLPLLGDPSLKKTGQNLKYDHAVLRAAGHGLAGIDGDTMLADYLLDVDRKHNLDAMALAHLGHRMLTYADTTADTGGEFARVPVDRATAYAAEDAHAAFLLDARLALGPLAPVYRDIELPLIPVLADMEAAGIGVDAAALDALSVELGARVAAFEADIAAEAGAALNPNSPKQLAAILFEQRKLPVLKKTPTGPSTDASVLERLAEEHGDKLCALILQYRELHKLKSTYVDALPRCIADDGRIHTSFHQAVAATGRLASNDPNLQNIPIRTEDGRRIRHCFVAAPGHRFLSADYSQVELRILAHLCGEGPLLEAFARGEDIHRRTAAEVFGVMPALVTAEQRRAAKAVNFGIIYGMSAFRLANELQIPRGEAQRIIDAYFARTPQVKRYMEEAVEAAKTRGYAETLFGRRRTVRGLDARNPVERGAAERIAINTPVQGTAADIIKIAMIRVHRRLQDEFPSARLLLQVHDELVLEVPDALLEPVRALVSQEMAAAAQLRVPLGVDTGDGLTWDAAH